MKTTYTKLILQDGILVPAPADFTGRHELVRVEHPLLATPLEVAAYGLPAEAWQAAVEAGDKHSIYGMPMRTAEIEEAFFFVDRSRPYSELKEYFPDIEESWATWTRTPYVGTKASGGAWVVYLHRGDCGWYDQSVRYGVRVVRAGECHGAVSFRALYLAWRSARRGKVPSKDQLAFDYNWPSLILDLERRLLTSTWVPSPPTCFIALGDKAREVHAPAFADRVVHHLIVPPLEAQWQAVFIHDSFSNRRGKGTHAAVKRLEHFVRQVQSGQGGGYYLQLDIKNFFNSIHRPTLYTMLKPRMERAGMVEPLRRAVHALLNYPISRTGVRWACTPAEREAVPAYKRLENAAPCCGIAIGNYPSQFFANVYMNPLDQFVKHELKAERYVRYVDDFVLVHHSREQLESWRKQIETFLRDRLRLELKAEQRLAPLKEGIDFLGYVVRPTHTMVRRRVVAHCRAKLAAFERTGDRTPAAVEKLRSTWHSYQGHFRHARHARLNAQLHVRFPWLNDIEFTEEPRNG